MRNLKSPIKFKWLGEPQSELPLSNDLRQKVLDRDQRRCVLCGAEGSLTIDHAIPQSVKVINEEWNLQTLCFACNIEKRDRTWWGPPLLEKGLERYGSAEKLNRFYKSQYLGQRWWV